MNYQDIILFAEEKNISRQLKHLLQVAQREAVRRQHVIGVCGTQDGKACSLSWSQGQAVFLDQGHQSLPVITKENLLRRVEQSHPRGVIFMRAFPSHRKYLQVRAGTQADNATFWYCDNQWRARWKLTMSRGGDITTRMPNRQGVLRDARGQVLSCH